MNEVLIEMTRENNAEIVTWILGFDNDTRKRVKDFILDNGMKSFLLQHKELDLSENDHDKIEVLIRMMQKYDGDIVMINFGDVDDMG